LTLRIANKGKNRSFEMQWAVFFGASGRRSCREGIENKALLVGKIRLFIGKYHTLTE
jgi:hypothetical protein